MKAYIFPTALIAAFAIGGLYARWQVTEDCMYLNSFKANGKVYNCEGVTEQVRREMEMEGYLNAPMKRPL